MRASRHHHLIASMVSHHPLPRYTAHEAGVKEVLLPADNLGEAQGLPDYILEKLKLTPVTSIDEVLRAALSLDSQKQAP